MHMYMLMGSPVWSCMHCDAEPTTHPLGGEFTFSGGGGGGPE